MSENTVYTLAKTLQKTDGLEKDFAQMLSALRDTVEKEYLLKIRSAANAETAFAKEHPPKEVTLLRALSAFMDEGGRAQLDRMTKGLMFLHTLQHVQRGVADFSEGNLLAARSAEGGAQCRGRRTGRFALRPIRKNGRSAANTGIGRAVLSRNQNSALLQKSPNHKVRASFV